ncbi:MAG TPA: ABC transporter substrate-binding protein [Chloroflexota bacterium]
MSDYRPLALNIIFRASHSTLWELADKAGILGSLRLSINSLEFAEHSMVAEEALFGGAVDFVAGNHITPYKWVAQGKPIVCLASPGNAVQDRIVTHDPISSLDELKGKTLRIADSSLHDATGRVGHTRGNHILDVLRAGFEENEMEWLDMGQSTETNFQRDTIEAVRTGKAQIGFGVGRGASVQGEGLHTLQLPRLPMVNGTTLTTTYETLQKREGLAERLVKALVLTIHYARVHPDEAQKFLDTKMGRPYPERGGRAVSIARYPMRPYPTTDGVANAYELCYRQYPETQDVSPFALWDMHYLRALDLSGFIDELIQEQPENVREAATVSWEG